MKKKLLLILLVLSVSLFSGVSAYAELGIKPVADPWDDPNNLIPDGGTGMASCEQYKITVRGKGGHGAMPHVSVDPITAACHIHLALQEIKDMLLTGAASPFMLKDESAKPFEFSFMPITQYGSIYVSCVPDSFSDMLEEFYSERDRIDRTRQRSADLQKLLSSAMARISRRLNNQRAELAACADKESLRINAELITAYQHNLKKGALFYEVENYYDNNKTLRIPADPALSPSANAQRYYKEYRKAKTAEQMLTSLIEQGEEELLYVDSVQTTGHSSLAAYGRRSTIAPP